MSVMPAPIDPLTTGCRLVDTDGRPLVLERADLRAEVGGGVAAVVLEQRFRNPYDAPLRVHYLLPLPADGAVVGFAFEIDGRRVAGRVERREEARATFEQAILDGRAAALLDQERPGLFTQELGNVPPGAEIRAEVRVEHPLAWRGQGWEWRWPTVVAPRFLGGPVADPEAVTVDVAAGGAGPACSARVSCADAVLGGPSSPSHRLAVGDGWALGGALDRDLVVRWEVAGLEPAVSVELVPDGDELVGVLTVVPPRVAGAAVPRDLVVLVDTSGSMGGEPLAQARRVLGALIDGLGAADRLELLSFGSTTTRWRPAPTPMDAAGRAAARAFLDGLRASGGTAMHDAIAEALRPLRPEAQRQVLLVSDGLIGFEVEVIGRALRGLPAASRVHVLGVGHGVNRALTAPLARAGAGLEVIVAPGEDPSAAAEALLARTGQPLVVDLSLSGPALREHAPARLPDLMGGHPLRVGVRVDPAGGELIVAGRTATGTFRRAVAVGAAAGRREVAVRYARERVEDLELRAAAGEAVDEAIEAVGLRFSIATRRTSWVAVDEAASVDPAAPGREVRVPHALAAGLSAEGVGLRPAGARVVLAVAELAAHGGFGGSLRSQGRPRALLGAPALPSRLPAFAPPPPAAPLPAKGAQRKERAARREEPAPSDPSAAPGLRRVRCTLRRLLPGVWVLSWTADQDLSWDPAGAVAIGADGTETPLTARPGSTRAGEILAGEVVRLVFTGPAPRAVRVGDVLLAVL